MYDLVLNPVSTTHCQTLGSALSTVTVQILHFKTAAMKCGFMTLPSLATALHTIREVGFLVLNTGGKLEGPYQITRECPLWTFSCPRRALPAWIREALGISRLWWLWPWLLSGAVVFEYSLSCHVPVDSSRHCGKRHISFLSKSCHARGGWASIERLRPARNLGVYLESLWVFILFYQPRIYI